MLRGGLGAFVEVMGARLHVKSGFDIRRLRVEIVRTSLVNQISHFIHLNVTFEV